MDDPYLKKKTNGNIDMWSSEVMVLGWLTLYDGEKGWLDVQDTI